MVMKRMSGFTIIELISAIVLICIIVGLVFLQKNNIDASTRDEQRKTAVNAIYYGLKEGYFPKNQSYPLEINSKTLPYIDPSSFTQIGDDSKYKIDYQALNCEGVICQGFVIKTKLEKESNYQKTVK